MTNKLKIPPDWKVITPPPGSVLIMVPAKMRDGRLFNGELIEAKKVGAVYKGSLPPDDKIYESGWNFLADANIKSKP